MITQNPDGNYPVDLRNVTHVRIGNQWTDIRPGSLVVDRPVPATKDEVRAWEVQT